ncbi:hypothetical protein K493DRAFT_4076 [Basidiobolus meristosporus CBS 931.73]|uniref:Uncharacterized protein n=1 Tax=Basidiobolus meristosporus CBS 931.73 TaxID=1314790 RepID=A0A1Y1YM48_9FUNG|nr:hypothetical protein K493DRAFT_4076 [Basidiobolus meristosporus CBS 931.73]|eukprot:ORX98836.1 hypothetical protein K493DRAFT_4076 [Basidiobolus meristosporus CBS 931.73]
MPNLVFAVQFVLHSLLLQQVFLVHVHRLFLHHLELLAALVCVGRLSMEKREWKQEPGHRWLGRVIAFCVVPPRQPGST